MVATDLIQRISIAKRTRGVAADALATALCLGPQSQSERTICDRWLSHMGRAIGLSPDGWYRPPPGGVCVLIGQPEDNFTRLNYASLRDPATWSRSDIALRNDSLMYAYSSPFDRDTGIIGDIGLTLYRGTLGWVHEYLATCLNLTAAVARYAEVGMEFRELFDYALKQISAAGLVNETSSTASGIGNIGHTVPWSYENYTEEEWLCLKNGAPGDVRKLISAKRVSINASANLKIQPTMAFTIEPQVRSATAPLCSYHVIVYFSEGNKDIDPLFRELFQAFDMTDYIGSASLMR